MAKRTLAKQVKRIKAVDKKLDFRTIANPAGSYIDAHGDAAPYHDQHADGGTYYDHPDSEHNDFHHDEAGARSLFKGDPVDLVSQSIDRLHTVMTKFQAGFNRRITRLEKRINSLEAKGKIR